MAISYLENHRTYKMGSGIPHIMVRRDDNTLMMAIKSKDGISDWCAMDRNAMENLLGVINTCMWAKEGT